MGRLSRLELQGRNRAKVLAAAKDEFAERGFREAKIDVIAERAELTRGAVYSNFPGKRALYFAVLAEEAEADADGPRSEPGLDPQEALGAFARAWLARLPLAVDDSGWLARDLMPEVLADERTRRPFAQLMRIDAILLGLALERLRPGRRMVRVAETALTLLQGASQMAAAAPGFTEIFNVVRACEQLAVLDLDDRWPAPPIVPPARHGDEPWTPPAAVDIVRRAPAQLDGDGVVAVLGLHRASAVEESVRALPAAASVTAVLVSSAPEELAPLVRLAVADLRTCLRQAFPASALPRLQVVCDTDGTVAKAAGVPSVSDATETAVRIAAGRIVTRAEGWGACHAAATA
ncbi:TetR/AcrR family transcriptional regulator [Pseudonocardia sp. TRM90224]|uniref:TetR/AcrR family transcriptional regulator n=1 Tax=Pseudonocardia sp. TRM90224 TaxID=2812678 RepID=UPI001E459624|nr:TetR/AcrR family transcriptional regulator [Pseudonocardia sp. TRM90224]